MIKVREVATLFWNAQQKTVDLLFPHDESAELSKATTASRVFTFDYHPNPGLGARASCAPSTETAILLESKLYPYLK